jgi:hypothetical protein
LVFETKLLGWVVWYVVVAKCVKAPGHRGERWNDGDMEANAPVGLNASCSIQVVFPMIKMMATVTTCPLNQALIPQGG